MNDDILNILINDSKNSDNKFLNQYINIINSAINENRIRYRKSDIRYVYYEEHHILPRSMYPEYINIKENKVLLLPREHFICHKCLYEIFHNKEMAYAFCRMAYCNPNKNSLLVTEDEYELARLLQQKYPSFLGRHHSQKSKELLSKKSKNYWQNGGYKHSSNQDEKMVNTRHLKNNYIQTKEQKLKKSKALKGKIFINNGLTNKRINPEDLENYISNGWKKGKKPLSEEHKRNIGKHSKEMWKKDGYKEYWSMNYSGKNASFYGKHHSEETKQLMSKIKKDKYNEKT